MQLKNYKLGSELSQSEQQEALNRFVHRYTGNHKPQWVMHHKTPLQFKDDADWLAHTRFAVTKAGKLHNGVKYCQSSPTWPNNPELRK
jgi:hypothetical protein